TPSGSPNPGLIPQPALYYPMNPPDIDISGAAPRILNRGTQSGLDSGVSQGSLTQVPGVASGAVHLAAANLTHTLSQTDAQSLKTSAITLSLWVRVDSLPTSRQMVFNLGNGDGPQNVGSWTGVGIQIRPEGANFFVEGGPKNNGAANEVAVLYDCVAPTRWNHLAGVFDPSVPELRMYRDGLLVKTTPTSYSTLAYGDVGVVMGRHSYFYNRYLDADVDEVAVWNQALTDAAILEVYRVGLNGQPIPTAAPL
ncbi:MAG: LamG domain-containing protein, partial [Myxococcales bacterium]|nr:LamG domain-containing protein [Myxococcales bacterium]